MKINTLEEAIATAFRGAYRGLRSQSWSQVREHQMRLRSADGKRCCAIGWLVPAHKLAGRKDAELALDHDDVLGLDLLADPFMDWYQQASDSDKKAFSDFLWELQQAHDYGDCTVGGIRYKMEEIRKKYGWPIPDVD